MNNPCTQRYRLVNVDLGKVVIVFRSKGQGVTVLEQAIKACQEFNIWINEGRYRLEHLVKTGRNDNFQWVRGDVFILQRDYS
jgi:hypothetical protein